MEKFNVGDRVKLVEVDDQDEKNGLKVGMVGTVVEPFSLVSSLDFDNWNGGWGSANNSRWLLRNFQIEKYEEKVAVESANHKSNEKFKIGDICRVESAIGLYHFKENDYVEVVGAGKWADSFLVKCYQKEDGETEDLLGYQLHLVARNSNISFLGEESVSRDELENRLGKSNRAMRKEVAKLAEKIGVISLSKVGGYRLVNKSLQSSDEIAKEMAIVQHQINENESRINHLNMRTSKLIADLKVLEEQQMDLIAKGK